MHSEILGLEEPVEMVDTRTVQLVQLETHPVTGRDVGVVVELKQLVEPVVRVILRMLQTEF